MTMNYIMPWQLLTPKFIFVLNDLFIPVLARLLCIDTLQTFWLGVCSQPLTLTITPDILKNCSVKISRVRCYLYILLCSLEYMFLYQFSLG